MSIESSAPPCISFRYRDTDTANGVTRGVVLEAARQLGLNETQFIHAALARVLDALPEVVLNAPIPESDITSEELRVMNSTPEYRVVTSSLFPEDLGRVFAPGVDSNQPL